MTAGPLAGFPVVDLKVVLQDGKTHDVDSSEMAFKIAGNAWFREASRTAGPVLLEPVMASKLSRPTITLATLSVTSTPVVVRCRAPSSAAATKSSTL